MNISICISMFELFTHLSLPGGLHPEIWIQGLEFQLQLKNTQVSTVFAAGEVFAAPAKMVWHISTLTAPLGEMFLRINGVSMTG